MKRVVYGIYDDETIKINDFDFDSFKNNITYRLAEKSGLLQDSALIHANTKEALLLRKSRIIPEAILENLQKLELDDEDSLMLKIATDSEVEFNGRKEIKALMRALRRDYGPSLEILEVLEENEFEVIQFKSE